MSSLHESRSHDLQTLSHAVHPSVAQKDENLFWGQWSGIIRNHQEKEVQDNSFRRKGHDHHLLGQ